MIRRFLTEEKGSVALECVLTVVLVATALLAGLWAIA